MSYELMTEEEVRRLSSKMAICPRCKKPFPETDLVEDTYAKEIYKLTVMVCASCHEAPS